MLGENLSVSVCVIVAANIITMWTQFTQTSSHGVFLLFDVQFPLTSTSCPHTCSFLWPFIPSLVRFHVLLSVQTEGNKVTLLHKNLCVFVCVDESYTGAFVPTYLNDYSLSSPGLLHIVLPVMLTCRCFCLISTSKLTVAIYRLATDK